MTDLSEFLLARIAEDEAAARAASIGSASWRLDDLNETVCWWPPEREEVIETERKHGWPLSDHWRGQTIESAGEQIAPHIARHDPARVLAECEAKRRIVEHRRVTEASLRQYLKSGSTMRALAELDGVLALLALPYADHPEYRAEWRP
jgi:hypothetical protein